LRLDLHVHTCYSEDCWVPLEQIAAAVANLPIDAIAVMDHNEIDGAIRLAEMAPFPVIVGEEIASQAGEIAGLFLRELISPGLSMEDTIGLIREQGGLVYAPHPLARDVPKALGRENLLAILDQVDIIEGFNARILHRDDNLAAQAVALKRGIPLGAGSDAHFVREIGTAGVELAGFESPQDFLQKLQQGRLFGRSTPYFYSLATCGLWYIDKFRELLSRVLARRPDQRR
jgi:predicted metal-dependent phosphoesterase TrpH